ncbi:MAG: AAA family ATPase [Candidatus Methanomethyliaceae archaeon]|nr:AAA family ATPase [Candidatus Methanomethyliaceae archaeon]MCX8169971.1 AAA family ATPase [Candidatus Methanomethyliaceae archaeon]MDW7970408.1 AAA family ATPase [Nitrososphaerota archaeon]
MKSIAIYGKGGIGKSTLASNIAAFLGTKGLKILLVGCDPKVDSAINIIGHRITPLLELMKIQSRPPSESFIFRKGEIHCVEIGGPEPGIGCAGRGLIVGINYLLENLNVKDFDFIIFDVPADIVCGGLAIVAKEGYAEGVLIVTSDEFTSLYAANNICRGLFSLKVPSCGIVYNKATSNGLKFVRKFAEKVELPIIGHVPRSDGFINAERMRTTLIEILPNSEVTNAIISLSLNLLKSDFRKIPKWLSMEEMEGIFSENS